MRSVLTAYVTTAVCFFALDLVWLGTMVNSFYKPRMAGLLLDKPNLAVAGLFYALYVVGMLIFAVMPALRGGSWTQALWSGALFGFFAYATYDMTNLATVRGFSPVVAVVDLAWGTVATGVAAALGTAGAAWMSRGL